MRNYHQYTDEERAYLLERIPETTYVQAAKDFEARFEVPRTAAHMADFANRHGLRSGYNGLSCGRLRWTGEMDDWLREHVPGHSQDECIDAFEERYGVRLRTSQLKNRVHFVGVAHGVNTGRIGGSSCKLVPGWNKGMRLEEIMSEDALERSKASRFKPGNVAHNGKPIGSEYVDKDGHVYVKVRAVQGAKRFGADGNWRPRAIVVYEHEHGSVPERCVVVHADRDPGNDSPGNLVAVDKRDYAVIMTSSMQYYDRESLDACVAIAKLKRGCYGAARQTRTQRYVP